MKLSYTKRGLFLALFTLAAAVPSIEAEESSFCEYRAIPCWTGFYATAGGGYGMWKQDHSTTGTAFRSEVISTGGEGWLGRVGGGFDWEILPCWIFGVLADYDFTQNLKGVYIDPREGGFDTEKQKWAWDTGARVGYLFTPSLLTFVSAGYTQTQFSSINYVRNNIRPHIPSRTVDGWFVGLGTEYALGCLPIGCLSWKFEYRYSSYSKNVAPIEFRGQTVALDHRESHVQTVVVSLGWRIPHIKICVESNCPPAQ